MIDENLMNELDEVFCGCSSDFLSELKDCAWNIVRENPGIDCQEWIDMLIRQYPAEVTDAIGSHPAETYASLIDMWKSEYTDPGTGECHSFERWAEMFATEASVELYWLFTESQAKIRRLEALLKQK